MDGASLVQATRARALRDDVMRERYGNDARTSRRAETMPADGSSGRMRRALGIACVLASLLRAPAASADPDPPPWLADKPRLHDDEIRKKVEGSYPTGFPLLDADPDTGYGGGARGYYYWNGDRSDPLFEYTPYRHRAYAQVFNTNKGYQDHELDYEWLYVHDTPTRLRATLLLGANASANYFGVGNDSMRDLASPATGQRFGRYDDYVANIRQVDALGRTYSKYNQYEIYNPAARVKVEREILGGLVRLQGGIEIGYARVREATGVRVSADAPDGSSVTAISRPTKLHEDCAARRVVGCSGGWNNSIKLGVAYDTRDFEPDPNVGVFLDLAGEMGTRAIGSSFDYVRVTFQPRAFWSPLPKRADLVFAARLLVSGQTSGTPFFNMDTLASTVEDIHGLGGSRTIRGFRLDRFVGAVATLVGLEVRWTMFEIKVIEQRFSFALVPFLDYGRVYDSFEDLTLNGWRRGEGVGIRIAWNQATVGAFDLGFSTEDTDFYTEFNHPF
jgi:hypothetical protein